jgi:hypothetical protein
MATVVGTGSRVTAGREVGLPALVIIGEQATSIKADIASNNATIRFFFMVFSSFQFLYTYSYS